MSLLSQSPKIPDRITERRTRHPWFMVPYPPDMAAPACGLQAEKPGSICGKGELIASRIRERLVQTQEFNLQRHVASDLPSLVTAVSMNLYNLPNSGSIKNSKHESVKDISWANLDQLNVWASQIALVSRRITIQQSLCLKPGTIYTTNLPEKNCVYYIKF